MQQGKDIIGKYKTWLRLEKSLSANSIEAYLTDLDKLTRFIESEGKDYTDITYQDLQRSSPSCVISAYIPVHRLASSRVLSRSTASCCWTSI